MVAPHVELRKYIPNEEFNTLALFQEFGFNPFIFSQHLEWRDTFTPLFKELDENGLVIKLGDTKNFCYVCSFRDENSDSFSMTDFYTPEFRRYRNRNGIKSGSIDALCRRLVHELDSSCAIRRIDFDMTTNISDIIKYNITHIEVYDNEYYNKGSVVVNGSIPQVDIDRRYFD